MRNLISRQSLGYCLYKVYGKIAGVMPLILMRFIRTHILPFVKKGLYIFFRNSGQVYTLMAPLAGHKMRLSWPIDRRYVLGTYEPSVCKVIMEYVKPGQIVFDVGAHIGYFTLLFASLVGAEGVVVAFEPLEENFRVLQENVQRNHYNNVWLENKAVSDKTGVVTLWRDEWWAFPAASHIPEKPRSRLFTYQVPTITLDEYVESKKISRVHFVKIDVEGAENLVIKGMPGVLLNHKPILVIEIHANLVDPDEVIGNLREFGYNVIRFNVEDEDREHILGIPASI